MKEVIGVPDPRRRTVIIVAVLALAGVLTGIFVWASGTGQPRDSILPPGAVSKTVDGILFAVGEFNLEERKLVGSLDIPKDRSPASWMQFKEDIDLWIEYGGTERDPVARHFLPMPRGDVYRVTFILEFAKDDPAPTAGQKIQAGISIPATHLKRPADLKFVVEGVEKVSK